MNPYVQHGVAVKPERNPGRGTCHDHPDDAPGAAAEKSGATCAKRRTGGRHIIDQRHHPPFDRYGGCHCEGGGNIGATAVTGKLHLGCRVRPADDRRGDQWGSELAGHVSGQEGRLVVPALHQPTGMERNRKNSVGADGGGAARAAQEFAEWPSEVRPIFVFQAANGRGQRAAVVPERHIDGGEIAVERAGVEVRGSTGPAARFDRRRAACTEDVMTRDGEIARRASRWAQHITEQSDQHDRCIVQIALSVAPAPAASAKAAGRGSAFASARAPP